MAGPSVSGKVKAQYEAYPYPHHPVGEVPGEFSVAACYTLAQYSRSGRLEEPKGKRALVAGCGTGFELHATTVWSPGFAEVIGIDFSEPSLAVARQRLAHHGVANARAQFGDLLAPETLPDGPFDYIGSHGVLHHLADPEAGLRNLAARLAPDGVMAIMLYNSAGRWPLYQARKALTLMGLSAAPLPEAVAALRAMMKDAQPGSLFHLITHGEYNDEYYRHDTNLVDNFLHAQDRPFSVTELPAYLGQAGLELVEMADAYRWRLATTMHAACAPFYERVRHLKGIDQLAVIEALNPFNNTEMIFWACHAGKAATTEPFTVEAFAAARWQVNPAFSRHAPVADEVRGGQPVKVAAWPLFFPGGRGAWPAGWQHAALTGIWDGPKSGAELLAGVRIMGGPPDAEALKWFGAWERDRVILKL